MCNCIASFKISSHIYRCGLYYITCNCHYELIMFKPAYIDRGLRQGCPFSPILYSDMTMIDAMEEIKEGTKVGGKLAKDVLFADDQ